MRSEFVAHQGLSGVTNGDIQVAIAAADAKASRGHFVVCETEKGTILVLPEMSLSLRNNIAKVHYDTEAGYVFNAAL